MANIITLLALVIFDLKTALQITILRTILGSLLSGTLFGLGFFMSFSGALTAALSMAFLLHFLKTLSLIGVSISGAATHNIGQLLMAVLILNYPGIFYYLPVMLLFSIPTGIITGLLIRELVSYIKATNRIDSYFEE